MVGVLGRCDYSVVGVGVGVGLVYSEELEHDGDFGDLMFVVVDESKHITDSTTKLQNGHNHTRNPKKTQHSTQKHPPINNTLYPIFPYLSPNNPTTKQRPNITTNQQYSQQLQYCILKQV